MRITIEGKQGEGKSILAEKIRKLLKGDVVVIEDIQPKIGIKRMMDSGYHVIITRQKP